MLKKLYLACRLLGAAVERIKDLKEYNLMELE